MNIILVLNVFRNTLRKITATLTSKLQNNIAKNIGLMYRAKPFLDKESLLALYLLCPLISKLW